MPLAGGAELAGAADELAGAADELAGADGDGETGGFGQPQPTDLDGDGAGFDGDGETGGFGQPQSAFDGDAETDGEGGVTTEAALAADGANSIAANMVTPAMTANLFRMGNEVPFLDGGVNQRPGGRTEVP